MLGLRAALNQTITLRHHRQSKLCLFNDKARAGLAGMYGAREQLKKEWRALLHKAEEMLYSGWFSAVHAIHSMSDMCANGHSCEEARSISEMRFTRLHWLQGQKDGHHWVWQHRPSMCPLGPGLRHACHSCFSEWSSPTSRCSSWSAGAMMSSLAVDAVLPLQDQSDKRLQ